LTQNGIPDSCKPSNQDKRFLKVEQYNYSRFDFSQKAVKISASDSSVGILLEMIFLWREYESIQA
jgi:hypothetical protein